MPRLDVEDLYKRYGYLVFRRCALLLGGDDDARDAMQEVFMKAIKYGHAFKSGQKPVPWLLQIANRTCFDVLRHRHREPLLEIDYKSTACTLSMQEQQSMIINLLTKFDRKTQDIVLLYYLEQMTMSEIAHHIGFSRKTIGKKINSFKRKVQKIMENEKNKRG